MCEPQYKHFCEECQFLGPYKYIETEFDLYYCEKKGDTPAFFARFSDEPADVYAAPVGANLSQEHPALWQARRQARMRKLIP